MLEKRLYQGPLMVKPSLLHGLGVFATRDLETGELIEECHCLLTEAGEKAFKNYLFRADEQSAIPLGFGCIYNHSPSPNIEYHYQPENNLMIFRTNKAVAAGEELCSSYGEEWFSERGLKVRQPPLWYRLKKQRLLALLSRTMVVIGLMGGLLYGLQTLNPF